MASNIIATQKIGKDEYALEYNDGVYYITDEAGDVVFLPSAVALHFAEVIKDHQSS